MEVVKAVYQFTQDWPKAELYGLTSQVRRAAVSIPANLAEGVGRDTPAEAARFAHVALGSLYELDTELCIAAELGYLNHEAASTLRDRLSKLSRQISSYITYKSHQT